MINRLKNFIGRSLLEWAANAPLDEKTSVGPSIDELKEFVTWAKTQKVKRLKVGDFECELSDIGLVESLGLLDDKPVKTHEEYANQDTLTDSMTKAEQKRLADEEADLLYWSSGGRVKG